VHPSAFAYLANEVRQNFPSTADLEVLELGSYNVNGTARDVVPGAHVHGIDIREGPGVDEVRDAGTYDGGERFELVLCAEALEHMKNPRAVIRAAHRSLKPGGLLIATMAAPERAPHDNNGNPEPFVDYYHGVEPSKLREWLSAWEVLQLQHHPDIGDLYVTARKRAG
jgi:SAM-dependent methyltransferase